MRLVHVLSNHSTMQAVRDSENTVKGMRSEFGFQWNNVRS